jgi:hypothetical protein
VRQIASAANFANFLVEPTLRLPGVALLDVPLGILPRVAKLPESVAAQLPNFAGDVNLVGKLSVHLEFEHNLDFHRRPLPVTGGSVEVKN